MKKYLQELRDDVGTDGYVLAKGLCKEEDHSEWHFFFVHDYDEKEKKFQGVWSHNNTEGKLSRIYMCFDEENYRKFAQRILNAVTRRKHADSIIRYNFFINEMPKQDVNELDEIQKSRLAKKAQKKQSNRELKFDLASLFLEINDDYAHTMNRLVFDKYIGEASKDVLPHDLVLPPIPENIAKYFGLLELAHNKDSKGFMESFKDFSSTTFVQKEEAIRVLELIKEENRIASEMSVFNINIPKPLKIEEFLSQQDSSATTVSYNLKGSWSARIISIIKTEFIGVNRGWASVPELKKGTYEYEKFVRFVQLVKE
jgi:dynein heavy chain